METWQSATNGWMVARIMVSLLVGLIILVQITSGSWRRDLAIIG